MPEATKLELRPFEPDFEMHRVEGKTLHLVTIYDTSQDPPLRELYVAEVPTGTSLQGLIEGLDSMGRINATNRRWVETQQLTSEPKAVIK